jgi:hypothetical protein
MLIHHYGYVSFQHVAERLRRPFVAADAAVAAGDAVLQVRVRITKSATGLELLDRTQVVFRAAVARRWLRPKSDLCRHWVPARLAEVLHDGVRHQLPYPSSSSGTSAREPQRRLFFRRRRAGDLVFAPKDGEATSWKDGEAAFGEFA